MDYVMYGHFPSEAGILHSLLLNLHFPLSIFPEGTALPQFFPKGRLCRNSSRRDGSAANLPKGTALPQISTLNSQLLLNTAIFSVFAPALPQSTNTIYIPLAT